VKRLLRATRPSPKIPLRISYVDTALVLQEAADKQRDPLKEALRAFYGRRIRCVVATLRTNSSPK